MAAPTRIQVRDIGGAEGHGWVPASTPAGAYVDSESYDALVRAITEHRTAIHNAGEVRVHEDDEPIAAAKHAADQRLWAALPTSPDPAGTGAAAFTGDVPAGEDSPSNPAGAESAPAGGEDRRCMCSAGVTAVECMFHGGGI